MEKLPKNHCRHYLLFFFYQSNGSITSLEAAKKICSVYGRSAISEKLAKGGLKNLRKEISIAMMIQSLDKSVRSAWIFLKKRSRNSQKQQRENLPKNSNVTLKQKRGYKKFFLLHDNARPHTSKKTQAAIKDFNFELSPHPSYSPDLAPTDFHLFLSLSNRMRDATFKNTRELEKFIEDFFSSKLQEFFEKEFDKLAMKWKKTIENNGEYTKE